MNIKTRLAILNFLQFFSWGTWLLSAGAYMIATLNFTGVQVGSVYATMGLSSMFMPPIVGIISDKWLNTDKVYGICHFALAILFIFASQSSTYGLFYISILLISIFYMPTLALANSISYYCLEKENYEPAEAFPPIRVWGTIGFIIAAWLVDLLGVKTGKEQFYMAALSSIILAAYVLLLPKVPIIKSKSTSLAQRFGLDAFYLFKNYNIATFLIFGALIGAALQITSIWGVPFLDDFAVDYKDSFVVRHSVFLMTLSQVSEVVFILAIPFSLKYFGIKKVVLISIFAWVFRFGFLGIGSPEGMGLVYLILSMVIYGVAFDFYFISGSLYINEKTDAKMRSGAQGLFMMMVNGFGAAIGAYLSGIVVDFYTTDGLKDWSSIWFIFAMYAFIVATFFAFIFKYEHSQEPKTLSAG